MCSLSLLDVVSRSAAFAIAEPESDDPVAEVEVGFVGGGAEEPSDGGQRAVPDLRHNIVSDEPEVMRGVSLDLDAGEFLCLLGPSGCGKTTLLRLAAGLERVQQGRVTIAGDIVGDDSGIHVPPEARRVGLMFQDYALFPHKDVMANVAFGLQMKALPQSHVKDRAAELLDLVGLSGYERRRVYDLSGGEQQRVALARSLAPDPRLLMLDEPLGSLDRALREELLNELREHGGIRYVSRVALAYHAFLCTSMYDSVVFPVLAEASWSLSDEEGEEE